MVNGREPSAAEVALALSYAPAAARPALTALWALDGRLREIARRARDPLIGLMRLVWWRDALARLDEAPAPAEPLLRALAATVLPRGVRGAALATMTTAWERVLDGDVDWPAVAGERAVLFALAAEVLDAEDARVAAVGAFWAAGDLQRDWPAAPVGSTPDAWVTPWPRALRPLGALGLLARFDAAGDTRPGSLRRVARLLAHRLTGR